MLSKEDDDFVASNSDSHVSAAGICDCQRDKLTHHQVQVEGWQMRGKWAYDKLEQVQSFQVNISRLISKEFT